MSVVVTKSQAITNRDASPKVLNNSNISKASMKKALGVVSIASGDSIGSTYLVCSIPSSALVSSVKASAPDIGTTVAADIGLYKDTAGGGAVVDADFFKAALDLHSGAISKSELVNGNVITVANMEKRIWEHLGLSSDPQIQYDVVATLTAAADAAGALCLEVDFDV